MKRNEIIQLLLLFRDYRFTSEKTRKLYLKQYSTLYLEDLLYKKMLQLQNLSI